MVAGEQRHLGTIALAPAAALDGSVVDEHGVPGKRVRVYLWRDQVARDDPSESSWHADTDDLGRYTFTGLPAGDYRVAIGLPSTFSSEPAYGRATVRAGERAVVQKVEHLVRPEPDLPMTRSQVVLWVVLAAVALILTVLAWISWCGQLRSKHPRRRAIRG